LRWKTKKAAQKITTAAKKSNTRRFAKFFDLGFEVVFDLNEKPDFERESS
jgi:hypothetical protein